ncbi:MAG: HAD family phosphatase [Candidatus Woesearchaeota archaeon]
MIFLFDCFGVVVDWKSEYVMPLWAKYANMSVDEFKRQCTPDQHLCESGQISQEELWLRWEEKFRVSGAGFEHLHLETMKGKARLNDYVVSIVGSLPSKCLFSNQMPVSADFCRQRGWFSHFDRLFLSFELNYLKPDPRAYYAVLKELGARPSDVVFIDDKKENVESAVKCGMNGIVFSNAIQLRSDLEKLYNVKISVKRHDIA